MDLEHKIDMLIEKRSSKLNIGIWSLVFLLLFGTPFSWLFGYIPTHNTTLGCLFVSLFLVFVFMFYHMSDKNIINTIKKQMINLQLLIQYFTEHKMVDLYLEIMEIFLLKENFLKTWKTYM